MRSGRLQFGSLGAPTRKGRRLAAPALGVLLAAALGGCAHRRRQSAAMRSPMLVPSASWSPELAAAARRNTASGDTRGKPVRLASTVGASRDIFPFPGALDLSFGRAHPYAYSDLPESQTSYFSTFTYDAEPIGLPGGIGYHYRYIVREGSSGGP